MTSQSFMPYCPSLTEYARFITREVYIGDVRMGGTNPIRVQSMTTTDTMNTEATVAQSIRMIEAGCELVRITAPSKDEAENLGTIKKLLRERGYTTPLVADIHFTPNAAEIAARLVEKVRVNPGNYADKKKFEFIEYTDDAYNRELERIRTKFIPLIKICKEYGTAMRIGTNHGSLSDRILSRYGDTPLGMVESAMEFIRICEEFDYHNVVISMKASNAQVMVQAYRLLVATMMNNGMAYPLHLGVTEAGDGEDGRIKSAVGIGALLEDGLGDTVRVSLTEEPEAEIPVAQRLIAPYNERRQKQKPIAPITVYPIDPYDYSRRESHDIDTIGGKNVPRIIADFSQFTIENPAHIFRVGYAYSVPLDKWNIADMACDYLYIGKQSLSFEIPGTLGIIQDIEYWQQEKTQHYPLFTLETYQSHQKRSAIKNFLRIDAGHYDETIFEILRNDATCVIILTTDNAHAMAEQRRFFVELLLRHISNPIIIAYTFSETDTAEDIMLRSATDAGALLLDGLGDGLMLTYHDNRSHKIMNDIAFGILQATRTRISKTEYISCPSCGRTLFDLQETTALIRSRTSHLKGVKIGIMGCIVNGPGEMADADYGYVGSGPGKITLYKGKEVVKKNVPTEYAVDELIALIQSGGDWVDVPASV